MDDWIWLIGVLARLYSKPQHWGFSFGFQLFSLTVQYEQAGQFTTGASHSAFQWPTELLLSVWLPGLLPNTAERCNSARVINLRYSPPAVTSTCLLSTAHVEPFVQGRSKPSHTEQRGLMRRAGERDTESVFVIKGATAMCGCSHTNSHPHPQTREATQPQTHSHIKW